MYQGIIFLEHPHTCVSLITLANRLIVGGIQFTSICKRVPAGLRIWAGALAARDVHFERRVTVVAVEANLAVNAVCPISAVDTFPRLKVKCIDN